MDAFRTVFTIFGSLLGAFGLWRFLVWASDRFTAAVGATLKGWLQLELDKKLAEHRHALDKQLEDYKLGPSALLAVFTHRAGALSQVQLEATRRIWGRLVDLRLGLLDLTAMVRPAETVLRDDDIETAEALAQDNRALAIALEKERAFLPADVYGIAADYFASVKTTLEAVVDRSQAKGAPHPDPQEATKQYKANRARVIQQHEETERRYESLAETIRTLTSPTLPA